MTLLFTFIIMKVKDIINTHYDNGYKIDKIPKFKVLVWNMDPLANKNIKMSKTTVNKKIINNKAIKNIRIRGFHTNVNFPFNILCVIFWRENSLYGNRNYGIICR
jgi:hypothetical protein